jgi:hypothetical protein
MSNEPSMPDSVVEQRLLGNLRRARLEMEEVGLQLDEVIARFDEEIRQQRLKRDYLQKRAQRGSWEHFQSVLAQVPNDEPEEYDRF